MTLIEKKEKIASNLNSSISTSFEEIYRTSYSHGLENIYALETIDIKTVRRIQQIKPETKLPVKKNKKVVSDEFQMESQLTLKLGENYYDWIVPFLLREPIELLGLSQQAKACLLNDSKRLIRDLVAQDLGEFVFLKGMGQGHIDEIEDKLESYINNRSITRAYSIDFASWLRTLTVGIEDREVMSCFASFGLGEVFSLSPIKERQMHRMHSKEKQQLVEKGLKKFRAKEKIQQVLKDWKLLTSVFVIPWMRTRHGLASKEELVERLQQVAFSEEDIFSYLSFFSKVYHNEKFPLAQCLFQSEDNVFCCDAHVANLYDLIITKALTYFYQPTVSYSLLELMRWILRDFARDWVGFSEEFVQLVLRRSSRFRVRKGFSGELEVRLS